ncbi:PA2169 family four-helix-bundle protein [Flavobacterium caseinilyticum]|uniref:PA2169 family four-helix-bundle protein n=1 Tax=Flavobacterium caseinilyticum TaxID=2541732 RepID=A0A4R5ATZ1_9FLAO|nr:PA2169 family four-helix-bundle protein [Flavobacterium caseinilyticum]TDD75470.1 PA2169 family four-helix-bundle protein [Flavobacterium caseinilyticum]
MNTEKSIVALNNLIEINSELIEVYKTATKVTEENDLKDLFSEFEKTSKIFKSELTEEVQKMGGIPVIRTKRNNVVIAFWSIVRSRTIGRDREDILNTLEYNEFVAVKSYKDTLSANFDYLTSEMHQKLKTQQNLLKEHHDRVKKLGDLMLSYK